MAGRAQACAGRALSRAGQPGMRLVFGTAMAGVAPFFGGYLISRGGQTSRVAGAVRCPILTLTGYPCPSCGGTRAFVAVARGEARWSEYNAPLVGYATALVVAAIGLAIVPQDRRDTIAKKLAQLASQLGRDRPATLMLCLVVATPPWLAAMASRHRGRA